MSFGHLRNGFFSDANDDPIDPSTFKLPPEIEEGSNIEYKLKLDPNAVRFQELLTQMKWRLSIDGEAFYEIGIHDDGTIVGLPIEELTTSLTCLSQLCDQAEASIVFVRKKAVLKPGTLRKLPSKGSLIDLAPKSDTNYGYIAEVCIRKAVGDQNFVETRIAVLGDTRTGKSSLLGVLSYGVLDDGRGRARLNLLKHRHEILTGRTSSISYEVIGFTQEGKVLNKSMVEEDYFTGQGNWSQLLKRASRVVTLIDLAGYEKYLKTTISGFMRVFPDYACLIISAAANTISEMTREHMSMAMALGVPTFIVLSKTDLLSIEELQRWKQKIDLWLATLKTESIYIADPSSIKAATTNILLSNRIPILAVSSVNGTNIDLLNQFMFQLLKKDLHQLVVKKSQEDVEFEIEDVFDVQDVGVVVAGVLISGSIQANAIEQSLFLGPSRNGAYVPVFVKSIHRQRAAVNVVNCGQSATLALENVQKSLVRKGMVILSSAPSSNPLLSYHEIEAEVTVISCPNQFSVNQRGTLYVGRVKQEVLMREILQKRGSTQEKRMNLGNTPPSLNKGDHAIVIFKFLNSAEYVKPGSRLLFRNGKTRLVGTVSKVFA